ncbi:hypothetical protein C8J56DRAFT_979601 [Mycena floridula]|nr:hypothetical protein C8J56DRAFT_979601 [Mycena floridula]
MKLTGFTVCSFLLSVVFATPVTNAISSTEDVLIFDAPAVVDVSGMTVSFETFTFLNDIPLAPITSIIQQTLASIGITLEAGAQLDASVQRLKLFAATGVSGEQVQINVDRCNRKANLPASSATDLGLSAASVSVGNCALTLTNPTLTAKVVGDNFTDATIYPSLPVGFGVISDVDDTIKITNVLNKAKLIQATMLDDPEPVPGMPELYKSLATSLFNPQFVYISGSPFHLYPFLKTFISDHFFFSKGPILLQNFTITDPTMILSVLSATSAQKLAYKAFQIERVHSLYPQKSFLAIGDSTEVDPEVYATAYKTYGSGFIRCIWIHVVDGANNTEARFAAAFDGIPANKFRLYNDTDIPNLANVNVAREC